MISFNMRLFIYIFLIIQLLNVLDIFAQKNKQKSSKFNSIKWEKIDEKSNILKKIIWKSYNGDESYFDNKNNQSSTINEIKPLDREIKNKLRESVFSNGDTFSTPLNNKDKAIINGGISVNNALIPSAGSSQIIFNYDTKGNLFSSYGYSLSNKFHLELLNIGSFNDINFRGSNSTNLYSTFLGKNNFNIRLGGKFLIFSPQKNDSYWLTLRASVGRNDATNKGYLLTELMNTFKLNNFLALNISPKYISNEVESFGGIGFSSYVNLSDNWMFIPEINISKNNDSNLNSTFALRYSFSSGKSLDAYYSNAAGIQDIGQMLNDNSHRFGIKLNFLY